MSTDNAVKEATKAATAYQTFSIMAVGIILLFMARFSPGENVAIVCSIIGLVAIAASMSVELFTYLQRGGGLAPLELQRMRVTSSEQVKVLKQEVARLTAYTNDTTQALADKVFSAAEKKS